MATSLYGFGFLEGVLQPEHAIFRVFRNIRFEEQEEANSPFYIRYTLEGQTADTGRRSFAREFVPARDGRPWHETVRFLADRLVANLIQDRYSLYADFIGEDAVNEAIRGPIDHIYGHVHNYLDQSLRMPDNMSCSGNTYTRMAEGDWLYNTADTGGFVSWANNQWTQAAHCSREEANKKARELLFSLLTEEQIEEYQEYDRIIILSEKGNLYKVRRAGDSNVYLLNGNDPNDWNTRYCAGIRDRVPLEDNLAAQILMLQGNEEEFIRIANVVESRLPQEQYRIYNGEASLGDGSRVRIDEDGIWRHVAET